MHPVSSVAILAFLCCFLLTYSAANNDARLSEESGAAIYDQAAEINEGIQRDATTPLNRQKRTLFLKKKLIGAGLLGFGLGIAKGYKAGYYSAPQVRHVYLSPPPTSTKYVEYVEKPIYVERIIERPAPVFKPVHVEYAPESAPYGSW